jgi:acyl-CoA thioesterase-1
MHIPIFIRLFILFFALTAVACEQEPSVISNKENEPSYTGTIVAVGDSLTAGFGVAEENAYPARLEKKLIADGYRYRVVNAGISGETSSGALSRINWVLTLNPDIVILETGANDGLRGIDPVLVHKNIEEIVRVLKAENVIVVLAGMRMVENLGPDYTAEFAAIYPTIAGEENLIFMPFFLEGVAGKKALNQPDGIHPTAQGYRRITDAVYPYVIEAIRKHTAG